MRVFFIDNYVQGLCAFLTVLCVLYKRYIPRPLSITFLAYDFPDIYSSLNFHT